MSLRTRITLTFIALTSGLLLTFSFVIYFSAKNSREREFFELLRKEAITKANLFFVAKIPAEILQNIYKNNRQTLNEVEVAIYDTSFALLYHDAYEIDFVKETRDMIDRIYETGSLMFYQNDWQVIGTTYTHEGKRYAITAAALDQYGYNKLTDLRNTLFLAIGLYAFIVFAVGRFFTQRIVAPLRAINANAKRVSASNLSLRVKTENTNDELGELARTFNQMLDRLEQAFAMQKEFVSNVAHELRTPLTAMIVELELLLSKPQSPEAYHDAVQKLLIDAQRLKKLIQNLIDFARASSDIHEVKFERVRLDEVLMEVCASLLKAHPDWRIEFSFNSEQEDESAMTIVGNSYLLPLAFKNVIENACKFSAEHLARVSLTVERNRLVVEVTDNGIGIDEDEIDKIFTPFYRGKNKSLAEGTGIGLALTKRIVELHKGMISISSQKGVGTSVTLSFQSRSASEAPL
jgi:two-component system sensor histidine kinase ArlS